MSWEISFSKVQDCEDNWIGAVCSIDKINHDMPLPSHKDGDQMVCGITRLELAKGAAIDFEVWPLNGNPAKWTVHVGQNNIVSVTCYHRTTPDSKTVIRMCMTNLRCTAVVDLTDCKPYPMSKYGSPTLSILYSILSKSKGISQCGTGSKKGNWTFSNCKFCKYRVLERISKAKMLLKLSKLPYHF